MPLPLPTATSVLGWKVDELHSLQDQLYRLGGSIFGDIFGVAGLQKENREIEGLFDEI